MGIPQEVGGARQSLLVTLILAGSAATVLGDLVARPLPRLAGGDAAIGGAALNAAPARRGRALLHEVRAAYDLRYAS